MISYIIDESGYSWHANDPNAPQRGPCPLCGASMYRRKSSKGTNYYALMPHCEHRYQECRKLDTSKILLDLELTAKEDFFEKLLCGRGEDPGKGNAKAGGGSKESVPKDEFISKIGTLRLLHITGHLASCNTRIKDGWLSDITINPPYAYMLLGCVDIGKRVLQGRPQVYVDKFQVIRMKIFVTTNVEGHTIKNYILADLHVGDQKLYERLKAKLFANYIDGATMKTKVRKKYSKIAVAGEWERIAVDNCKQYCDWDCEYAGWHCAGYLHTEIRDAAQAYPMVTTPVRD